VVSKLKVAITTGDINGIGIELIIKSFKHFDLNTYIPIVYGSEEVIRYYINLLNTKDIPIKVISNVEEAEERKLNIINIWDETVTIDPGKSDFSKAKYAFLSIERATADTSYGSTDCLITNPINKHLLRKAGMPFIGHTEYLTAKFDLHDSLMLLSSKQLRVGVATGHIPIKEVALSITQEKLLSKLDILYQSLKIDFNIKDPKIAVFGLNPHAGDNGLIGNEDKETIQPAIAKANENGMKVTGPISADSFFGAKLHEKFDAILAMYHDQGLTPFKTLAFNTGVNFTAGLPIVRTSPDHGPAFEIAGRGVASLGSFVESLTLAANIANNRGHQKKIKAKSNKVLA